MFSTNSGRPDPKQGNTIIPHGTLAKASFKVQSIGNSKRTGAEYAKLDFTIVEGEFAGRHVFTVVMNPKDNQGDKAAGAKMGEKSLCYMMEAAGFMVGTDEASVAQYDGWSFQDILAKLEGNVVAIRIKVAKGEAGFEDKNEVGQYLSPIEASGSKRLWDQLNAGAPVQKQAFVQPAKPTVPQAPKPSSAPSWLKRNG
jgi:hypothetical protein